MTREERITYYEEILDQTAAAIRNLDAALNEYEAVRPLPDAAGTLPQDLKRGVLSEDGIDDVLSDFRDLEERLAALKEKKL